MISLLLYFCVAIVLLFYFDNAKVKHITLLNKLYDLNNKAFNFI
nr:MAG TPA: hypothetical protein [Caudoviricetes sp.]